MAWLRMHDGILDHPKIQMLSDRAFRMLINLWALAKRHNGKIPGDIKTIAFALRLSGALAQTTLEILIAAKLINKTEDGYEPHDWKDHQYERDVSTQRVKRFRERKKRFHETAPDTDTDTDTETDTETEADIKLRHADACNEIETPVWIPTDAWNAFREMRHKIRAPLTPHAATLAIAELGKLREQGHDLEAVLNRSTMHSWRGLFPPTHKPNGSAIPESEARRTRLLAKWAKEDAEKGKPS